jgi:hypothetical protein
MQKLTAARCVAVEVFCASLVARRVRENGDRYVDQ